MMVDDPVLPAAAYLTGPAAQAVLSTAVAASGAELSSCRVSQVQYRPGADLVVRYHAVVTARGVTASDTLLAATTPTGAPAGTLAIEAETADGSSMQVGVWRWPFDPTLAMLETAVTPHLACELLGDLVGERPVLEVVAYRPTERAVVRVDPGDGRATFYVKVVPLDATSGLVTRHSRLSAAGLPVPCVLSSGPGWLAMGAIAGPTLREHLKSGTRPWPPPREYASLLDGLGRVDPSEFEPARSRIEDAHAHAAMLASILPSERLRLARIADLLASTKPSASDVSRSVIHGYLHEAQLVLEGDRVVGLLDIDDVGTGDPLDDVANLVGHLTFRGATTDSGADAILRYAAEVCAGLADGRNPKHIDRAVAATLVGLATGPFRVQQAGWERTTAALLGRIEHLLGAAVAMPVSR